MPFCENCGNKVNETSKFCAGCGFPLKLSKNTEMQSSDLSKASVITNQNNEISAVVDFSILSVNEEKLDIKKKNPYYKSFLLWFWIVMAIFYYTCRIGWWGESMSGEIGSRIFIRIFVGVNALYFANKLRSNSKNN